MISGVNGQRPVAQGANEPISIQNKIQKLEEQKKILEKEKDRLKSDNTIDKKTAASKIKDLEKKIKAIDIKIEKLKQEETKKTEEAKNVSTAGNVKKEDNPNLKKSMEAPKDIYEKGDAAKQWDNTYSIVQEEGETRIKYNRPKKNKLP